MLQHLYLDLRAHSTDSCRLDVKLQDYAGSSSGRAVVRISASEEDEQGLLLDTKLQYISVRYLSPLVMIGLLLDVA